MSGRSGMRPRSASWRWTGRPLPASQDRAPHGWARSRTLVSSPFKGSWHKAPEGLPPNPCHPCDARVATVIRPPGESNAGPAAVGMHQYGSTAWLPATRRRLVPRNAPAEIDSTFIRRYQVQSTIGLPLLTGDRLLGLVYLNYRIKERAPDDNRLRELERKATTAAGLVQAALEGAERAALDGLSRLTSLLTTPVGDARTDAKELRRLLSIA